MKIKELIKDLEKYNPEAEVSVIAHFKSYKFSLVWGSGDSSDSSENDKLKSGQISFYVDELCTNEQTDKKK